MEPECARSLLSAEHTCRKAVLASRDSTSPSRYARQAGGHIGADFGGIMHHRAACRGFCDGDPVFRRLGFSAAFRFLSFEATAASCLAGVGSRRVASSAVSQQKLPPQQLVGPWIRVPAGMLTRPHPFSADPEL